MKGQSNPEISRSPRNSFRASVARSPPEVEHRMDEGASPPTESNRTPNAGGPERGSQSMWAKLCAREGNSPDRPLRSPSSSRVAKDVRPPRQPGCWLRSSHAFKECVTAHWSSGHAPTIHGAKLDTEAAGFYLYRIGRGASHGRRSRWATGGGAHGSENAGMSSERRESNSSAVNPRFPGQG